MVDSTHHIACAALIREQKVLLGHRNELREYYPNCWDLIGGHVEPGESPEEALARECREELGVDVIAFEPIDLRLTDPGAVPHHYVVTSWRGEPSNTAPHEHDEVRWFTAAQLADVVLADAAYLPQLTQLLSRD